MRSLCNLFFLGLISFVAACTVPLRTGYDRELGEYAPPPSASTNTSAKASTNSDSDANVAESSEMTSWMDVIQPWLNTPYRYGGNTKNGTDCSGYVMQIYKEKTGKQLPHSSRALYKMGKSVNVEDLQTGDLVFFGNHWGVNHVGIYLSNGNFTHASSSDGVAIIPLSTKYWKKRYLGARRLL